MFEHIGIDVGATQLHCVALDRDGELLDAAVFAAAELDELARGRDAGGAQQLLELGEIVALGQGGDHHGTLPRAPGLGAVLAGGRHRAAVSRALHPSSV